MIGSSPADSIGSTGSVDMTFVTQDVDYGTWLEWGSSITGITDMVDQAIAKLKPGQCIGRLIICAHGSAGGGFMQFDPSPNKDEVTGSDVIDGKNIDRHVKAELQRLRKYMCPNGVIEFRCCHFGAGNRGQQALQAIADLTGVAVTAPEDTIQEVMFFGGITVTWATAYPSSYGIAPTSSFWRSGGIQPAPADAAAQAGAAAGAAAVAAMPQFVPVIGLNPQPPGPARVSAEALKKLPPASAGPRPNQGYDQLAIFVDWLEGSHEFDTPPPTDYRTGHLQYGTAPPAQPYQELPPLPSAVQQGSPPPPIHYDLSPPPLQPVPDLAPSFGSQPMIPPPIGSGGGTFAAGSFADAITGGNGCLTAARDFLTGRLGCAALAGLVAVVGIGLYLANPDRLGLTHSSASPTPTEAATVASSPASGAGCTGPAMLIEDQFKGDLVLGGSPTQPSTFSTGGKKYCLTHLATYHWNGGQGDPAETKPNPSPTPAGGTLWLEAGGKVFGGGPWFATATPGTGGALVNWEVDIPIANPVILDGTYTVGDSRPATWSWSAQSNHAGFFRVWATAYTGP